MTVMPAEFQPLSQMQGIYDDARRELARADLDPIMRRAWEALHERCRPLPGNGMIIISAVPREKEI